MTDLVQNYAAWSNLVTIELTVLDPVLWQNLTDCGIHLLLTVLSFQRQGGVPVPKLLG